MLVAHQWATGAMFVGIPCEHSCSLIKEEGGSSRSCVDSPMKLTIAIQIDYWHDQYQVIADV